MIKHEEISTDGGCTGIFVELDGFTLYITKAVALTTPVKGDHVEVGLFDQHFSEQLYTLDIKPFEPLALESYCRIAIDLYRGADHR